MVKGQGHQAALVGCTDRPTGTYSNGDLSIYVHDVYRVTTCRPGRGHIVAAARPPIQLVYLAIPCVELQDKVAAVRKATSLQTVFRDRLRVLHVVKIWFVFVQSSLSCQYSCHCNTFTGSVLQFLYNILSSLR